MLKLEIQQLAEINGLLLTPTEFDIAIFDSSARWRKISGIVLLSRLSLRIKFFLNRIEQNKDFVTANGIEIFERIVSISMAGKTRNDREAKIPLKRSAKKGILKRDEWRSKTEFMLTCFGYTVGLTNIWKFPYFVYKHGGGAFIVPYIVLAFCIGKPMYFIEAAIGQFNSKGIVSLWSLCPVARGVGISKCLVTLSIAIYNNVLMVYCLFYVIQTFRAVLPWTDCMEWWGADENCYVRSANVKYCDLEELIRSNKLNESESTIYYRWDGTPVNCTNASVSAPEMFWERYVLEFTKGTDRQQSGLKLKLLICLLLSWVICYFCIRNGIKTSGKVVYYTATIPYLILGLFFLHGLTLEGSHRGIYHYFLPDWHQVFTLEVWMKALQQVFFSLNLACGGLTTFTSYNKFHNQLNVDVQFLVSIDTVTSVLGGIVVFSFLGSLASKLDVDIEKVVKEGSELAFVIYPEALSKLALPHIWTFLFFMMLFLLGIEGQFCFMEIFLTAIIDWMPRTRPYKPIVNLVLCTLMFFFGLPCLAQSGQYLILLLDEYAGGLAITFIGLSEITIVMWIYGVENFCDDVEMMLRFRPKGFIKASWSYFIPVLLSGFFFIGIYTHARFMHSTNDPPMWLSTSGILLTLFITGQIPGWAIYYIFKYREDIRLAFSPSSSWGPADPDIRRSVQLRVQRRRELQVS